MCFIEGFVWIWRLFLGMLRFIKRRLRCDKILCNCRKGLDSRLKVVPLLNHEAYGLLQAESCLKHSVWYGDLEDLLQDFEGSA